MFTISGVTGNYAKRVFSWIFDNAIKNSKDINCLNYIKASNAAVTAYTGKS